MTSQIGAPASEDRTMPTVVYALYLLGFVTGITFLLGLIVAYVARGGAGPRMESHLTFAIRSCWLAIAWWIIGGCMFLVGLVFSILLIGIPVLMVGAFICGLVWLWFLIRTVLGLVYLARDESYPRPLTWLF